MPNYVSVNSAPKLTGPPRSRPLATTPEYWDFLAAVIDSSDDAIITKNLDGIILTWNKSAEALFGYTAEEAIGKPVAMLIPENRHDEEPNILARLRKGERIEHYETVRRHKNGTLLDISLTVSPVRDSEGRIIGASKIVRNITGRKISENESHFLAAVVQSSDDAIITKTLDGIITTWNKGAERIFGYTAVEVIGKPITILIPDNLQHEEPMILSRLRRGERIEHYETTRRRKDGTLLDISLTLSPVRDDSGRILGASKIARDVTELKRARAALARSNEDLEKLVTQRTASLQAAIDQMEEFSYSVSHDLRAPVRAMQGYAKAALEDCDKTLEPTARDYLDRILASASRMQHLIEDVLIYSKVARSEVSLSAVSLDKLVAAIIEDYPELQSPNAEIQVRRPLHAVCGNVALLTQAISNLLGNAVKFVQPSTLPKVNVWSETKNGTVRVWFEDNGIGIDPQLHDRLFKMFERLHHPTKYEGTGIGLAIVRKAMEKMGGSVGAKSDGIHGSSFWLELPAAPEISPQN